MVNSYLSVSSPAHAESFTLQRYRLAGAPRWLGILAAMAGSAPTSTPVKPDTTGQRRVDPADVAQSPWVTIVWDDPVNLMTYVTYIFQKLFGYSEPHATKLMLQVHNEGKSVVSAGSRESMEVDVSKLHAAGLWATMQQDR
jgi:ATP-dependent Clp protease adaptor protein ClpS